MQCKFEKEQIELFSHFLILILQRETIRFLIGVKVFHLSDFFLFGYCFSQMSAEEWYDLMFPSHISICIYHSLILNGV